MVFILEMMIVYQWNDDFDNWNDDVIIIIGASDGRADGFRLAAARGGAVLYKNHDSAIGNHDSSMILQ